MPITPGEEMKPTGAENPLWGIIKLLLSTVGIQYVLISATGPLLQHRFTKTNPDTSPYRLFALSNLGSLLGLLTYPFVFEPMMTLNTQTL